MINVGWTSAGYMPPDKGPGSGFFLALFLLVALAFLALGAAIVTPFYD